MKTVLLLGLLSSLPSWAGGWVSSGGELFRDAKNPWFVRSTPLVHYCVRIDEAGFSTPPDTARRVVRDAIDYWRSEFSKTLMDDSRGMFTIGTQEFQEVDCALGVALLEFRLGHGTLGPEENDFLKDPLRFIGVSVRTSYDEKELRGKGFVFIASDRGASAYRNPGNLIERAWENERLLFYALLHELGHVFGLPHAGSGLMAEVFLEQMLNRAIAPIFISSPVESFFSPDSHVESCALSGADKQWFGLTQDYECVSLAVSAPYAPIAVVARRKGSATWDAVGTIKDASPNLLDMRSRPAVYLQLPPGQGVFTDPEAAFRPFMLAGNFVDYGAEAVYVATSGGAPRSAYLRITPSSVQVAGQQSGKLRVVFSYASLIGTKLLLVP